MRDLQALSRTHRRMVVKMPLNKAMNAALLKTLVHVMAF